MVHSYNYLFSIHSILIDIFFSYVTFTFVIETITITNSIIQLRKLERMKSVTRALKSVTIKNHFINILILGYLHNLYKLILISV